MIGNGNMLEFSNIQEIKFTRVGYNIFSISIKSDIQFEGEADKIEDATFNSQLCKINPELQLKFGLEFTDVIIDGKYVINSQTYNIPLNIQLLVDKKLEKIFTIEKEV